MMGTRPNGSTFERTYEEFEPFCSWNREEGRDILEVHLPDFKKDQLKVRVNSLRVLMITGERPINASRWSRFCKELPIPSNANANEIRAKFTGAKLFITMPKVPPPAAQTQEAARPNQDDTVVKNDDNNVNGNGAAVSTSTMLSELKNPLNSGVSMNKKMVAAVAVVAISMAMAVGAYVTCKYYWS